MARYFDSGGIARLSVGRIIFVAVSGVVTNAPAAAAAATVWGGLVGLMHERLVGLAWCGVLRHLTLICPQCCRHSDD